ncbi:MAG TPA: Rieske (2Fe-2S) protein [Cellulomonas sp.]
MGSTTPGAVAVGPTRREVLAGAGLLAGAGVLVACGAGSSPGGAGGGGAAPGAQSTGPLAAVADIPVGGAVAAMLDGKPIVLTQAQAGTIVGLSAICTHQGCTVGPHGGELLCPCHGSVFALDGSNVAGPAPSPLPAVPVHVVDGEVLAGAG